MRLPASPPSRKNSCSSGGCCVIRSVAWGERGFYMDSLSFHFYLRPLSVPSHEGDYVITVVDTALEPAHSPGTLLAVTHKAAEQNQLSVFSESGRVFSEVLLQAGHVSN